MEFLREKQFCVNDFHWLEGLSQYLVIGLATRHIYAEWLPSEGLAGEYGK
jgi:hypothetical protein